MAIAFARISYHSRSQGHSAVAGSAYRAGVALYDERTGEHHDFQKRSDVAYSKILLPEGADPRFADRQALWNAVEEAETRKNSQVAKDIVLALPRDLELSQHIDLAHHFAQHHFVQHGLVADIAIHDHGDGNPHAHIYVTTRRLHGTQFDKYKARDLEPDVARGRVVDPQYWGERWRELQNTYFKQHGIDLLVDANHIFSQRHEGRIRGKETHYLKEENQLRRQASIEIALNDPDSVLNLLGARHAVFSDRDMALLLHKNTDSREQYETALRRLKAHPDLVLLGPGDDGRDRYTTHANYEREATLADHATRLATRHQHIVHPAFVKDAADAFTLNPEQRDALLHVAHTGDVAAIVGRAGTGKSYLMRAARQVWERSGYEVRGVTVSGIAAKGLEADSGIASCTIHSLKSQLAFGSLTLGARDIVVMDEAGMTNLHDMADIVAAVKAAGAKLVVVGDPAQLQPIGAGAPFRAMVEQVGFAELCQIQRQMDAGDREASVALSQGNVARALDHYHAKQQLFLVGATSDTVDDEDGDGGGSSGRLGGLSAIDCLIADWSRDFSPETIKQRLILAHRNVDVDALNRSAREAMRTKGFLGYSQSVNTVNGPIELAVGDRLLFLRNDKQLHVSNGEFATVTALGGERITVQLDKGQQARTVTFSTRDYHDFNYGYAATVHKSQGTTVDQSFIYVAGRMWDRYLAYVAMTRHRHSLNIYADRSQFDDIHALKTTLSRTTFKDNVLDWPLSYAIRRGFDPESLLGRFIDKVMGVKYAIRDKWHYVFNYGVYQLKNNQHQTALHKGKQREAAKKVALYIDLRNSLGTQARHMRCELSPNEPFYAHHDYMQWYEHSLLRNQLAYEIKQTLSTYQDALTLNRVGQTSLEKHATQHERWLRTKTYIHSLTDKKQAQRLTLASAIQREFEQHYPHMIYQAKQQTIPINDLCQRIKSDAQQCDKSPQRTGRNEWDSIKTIESPAINQLIVAKERLDQATKPLEIRIYTRSYEQAVRNILHNKTVFQQVEVTSPALAQSFRELNRSDKAITIDWLSTRYDAEFDALRQSKDQQHQTLVKFRDQLQVNKDTSKETVLLNRLNSIAMTISKYKNRHDSLNRIAPKLVSKFIAFSKSRKKDIGRDP